MASDDPRDPVLWTAHAQALTQVDALRKTVLAARYADDAAELLTVSAERAALASMDATKAGTVAAAVREGAACGTAAALCASRREGTARVRFADGAMRDFPVGGRTGWQAPRWSLAAALASCAGDAGALETITHPLAVQAAQEPPEVADTAWTPFCIALAALYRGEDGAAASLLSQAIDAFAPERLRIADPGWAARTRVPLLRFAQALAAAASTETLRAALTDALAEHARHHGAGDGRGETLGLLAFELAGLCALAKRRGLVLHVDSPLLPDTLLAPASGPAPTTAVDAAEVADLAPVLVDYEFPPRRVLHDREPQWFLDLQGFPRVGRRHELVTQDDCLIAIHHADGCPGLPPSRCRFALPDSGPAPDWPLALTAAELFRVYAALRRGVTTAQDASDDSGAQALHAESLQLLDALERRFPAEAASAGITLAQVREERTRLTIPPAVPAPARALASIALISEQVRPLLGALNRDATGAIAAQLRPRPGDYAAVFHPEAVAAAREAYEAMWTSRPPAVRRASATSRLVIQAAPAGMLGDDNALSGPFPTGYRPLVPLLDPHRIWVTWQVIEPGHDAGMRYDGLVWVDDHWTWFPKPFRALAALLGG
ncbi:Imm49 family immunity protein [Roseateles chitinivorans]|uniref:Imm49 family immunity protein n=1 Tax=Roseateles chitinivorans TaxID=2917965 RepID=UPI003D669244